MLDKCKDHQQAMLSYQKVKGDVSFPDIATANVDAFTSQTPITDYMTTITDAAAMTTVTIPSPSIKTTTAAIYDQQICTKGTLVKRVQGKYLRNICSQCHQIKFWAICHRSWTPSTHATKPTHFPSAHMTTIRPYL